MNEEEIIDTITKQLKRKADYDTGVHLPQLAVEGLLDLYQQEKEKNKELEKENWIMRTVDTQYISKDKITSILELEKEINQEAINIANNQLCNYELGYQAGLHKEITATEVVIINRENFIIQQQIKRLQDTIYGLSN